MIVLAVLAVWLVATASGAVPETFLPGPFAVLDALARLFVRERFIVDIGASVYRVMAGYLLAAFLAIPLGVALGASRTLEKVLEPIIGFFRYLPVPALVPLCILWIGIGNAQKIAVIFLGTFFQLTILVADSARATPGTYLDLAATLGLTRFQRTSRVLVPAAMPGIYDALRVCMGWAWSYLVVAEFVAASNGMGHVIIESQRYLKTSEVFAAVLSIGIIGVLFDLSFIGMRRVFFPWATRRNG